MVYLFVVLVRVGSLASAGALAILVGQGLLLGIVGYSSCRVLFCVGWHFVLVSAIVLICVFVKLFSWFALFCSVWEVLFVKLVIVVGFC